MCSERSSEGAKYLSPGRRRCEKIVGHRPLRLRRSLCGKPTAFRQVAEPKEFNLKPAVRKGRALPHSRRQSRDFFTPAQPWGEK